MRRFLSITLLLLFGLPLIAPLFALGATVQSRLPACCRKAGTHHCMQSAEELAALEQGRHFSEVRSRCPMFPIAAATLHHEQQSVTTASLLFAEVLSPAAQFPQVEAWARVALEGARQKRGPPSLRLS